MNGPAHYLAAEEALENAADVDHVDAVAYWHRKAQVHATLALTAATVECATGAGNYITQGSTVKEWQAVL